MLMDVTVILATSRDKCLKKLQVLLDYCIDYGMVINEKKTKFMAINTDDKTSFTDSKVKYTIDHCDSYLYLGCIFTCDASIHTALKQHVQDKKKHLLKLNMFFSKNQDIPFFVKLKVLNACFMSAILYSCESWINISRRPLETLYIGAVNRYYTCSLNRKYRVLVSVCLSVCLSVCVSVCLSVCLSRCLSVCM